MPGFAAYVASWGLQNASFRKKFTAMAPEPDAEWALTSNQSDGEHGGLGAPAPLNK